MNARAGSFRWERFVPPGGAALRKAGCDVREAEGGRDALQKFQLEPVDMVMLDVDMPDLGGHQVSAALRASAGELLPIVMVTGMDDLRSIEAAYESGATDFIAKPVNWTLLRHRIRYLFRSCRAMRDLRAAEARNAAILNAIPDLLFEVDIDGRYIDYRAPRTELLTAPPEAILGKTVEQILPRAAAQKLMLALHTALAEGACSGVQIELPLARGSTWFELPVFAQGGRSGGAAALHRAVARDHRAQGCRGSHRATGLLRQPDRSAQPAVLPRSG